MAKRKCLCIKKPQFVRLVKRYVLEDVPALDQIEFFLAKTQKVEHKNWAAKLTWSGSLAKQYNVYLKRNRGVNKLHVFEYHTDAVFETPTEHVYDISDAELVKLHLLKEVA